MSTRDENHVASAFRRTDELIDGAARDLTRGEPSPRLRHAVRRRIEQRQARARTWLRLPAFAGAVAVLLLAIVQHWPNPEVPSAPGQTIAIREAAPAVLPRTPPVEVPSASPPRVATQVRRASTTRPLEPIEPLVVEPIVMPLMAVTTSSGAMPIEIEELQIEPLQIQ